MYAMKDQNVNAFVMSCVIFALDAYRNDGRKHLSKNVHCDLLESMMDFQILQFFFLGLGSNHSRYIMYISSVIRCSKCGISSKR